MKNQTTGRTSLLTQFLILAIAMGLPVLAPKAPAQQVGYALNFQPLSNNYVNIHLTAPPATNYSLTTWVFLRTGGTFTGTRMAVLGGPACNTSIELLIRSQTQFTTDAQYLELGRCSAFNGTPSTTAVPLNAWTHVAVTVNSNKVVSYYLNGLPAGSWTNADYDFSLNSTVFLADNSGGRAFDGQLNNVQIWQRVLTPAEVLSNLNHSLTGSETGLLGWYPFLEGSGTTTTNAATNVLASAGTLVNHPLWGPATMPAINSLFPATGPTVGGITNTLQGINFGTSGTVTIGGVQASVIAWSQTTIQCRLPAGQGMNQPVIVTVAGQSSAPVLFNYDSPFVFNLYPSTGPTVGGITNTLQGINFGNSGTVTVGGVQAAIVDWSQTTIRCRLPAGQGMNQPVIVNVGGQSSTSVPFHYNPPVISSVSPATDPTAGDTIITVAGINFGTTAVSNTVTVNGVQAAIVAWSQTNIQCLLPAGQGTNLTVIVTVVGQNSAPVLFSYNSLFVFSLSPSTGPTIGGITNTLQGINFGNSGTVTVGGVQAAIVDWSQTTIRCRLPAGQGMNQPVIVTAGGQSSAPVSFRYDSPAISSLNPATGPTAGGITNTLQGINFGTSGTVTIGEVPAAIIAWSQTSIQYLLPAGQGTNLPVIVTVAEQSSTPASFSYNSPAISSLSPTIGPTAGGITNTLRGINFGTSGTVTFDGVQAAIVAWSQTNIQCRLPAGQGTNLPVIITVAEQSSKPASFSYNSPVIVSLSPANGPTTGGITNALQGINFGTSGTVTIGEVPTAIIAWSQTSIQYLLPAGQGTNLPIIVTASGQSSPPASFSYNPPVIFSLSPATDPTAGDTIITVTGINFGTTAVNNTVTIDGVQSAIVAWSQTSIQCLLPAGQGTNLPMIVTVAGQSSPPALFSYSSPFVFSLSPATGPTIGGVTNTLQGINFGTSGTVTFDGVQAAIVAWSQTNIQCRLPAGEGTNLPVIVTAGGQSSAPVSFRYNSPVISSLSPATGPTIGGVTNTLQGINFGTSGTVIFDGVQAAIVAWSQTNIQC
ncbi:MAG: IPT/TIG domain-containing protein, partial [Verrucomicrobiota bacterium]